MASTVLQAANDFLEQDRLPVGLFDCDGSKGFLIAGECCMIVETIDSIIENKVACICFALLGVTSDACSFTDLCPDVGFEI
jgi:hypothetical protein